jgi:ATP-dependent Lon protease
MWEKSAMGDSMFQDWWSQMGWPQGTPFSMDDMDFGSEHLRASPGEVIEAPLLPLRDMVMFPRMVTPLFVGRDSSVEAIEAANELGEPLITVAQRDSDILEPGAEDLFTVGVEVEIGRMLRMPDGTVSVLSQGLQRVQIVEYVHLEPYIRVRAVPIYDEMEKKLYS